jgi:oligoendopeptidase F
MHGTVTATQTTAPRWSDYEPRYRNLIAAPLNPDNAAAWLNEWSELAKDVGEAAARVQRAKDANTLDQDAEAAFTAYLRDLEPQWREASQALTERLLALDGWEPDESLAVMVRDLRNDADLYREANVPLLSEHTALGGEFDKTTGALTVRLDGEEVTVPQAQRLTLEPDRETRERAWRAIQESRLSVAGQLDELFLRMLRLRCQLAENAGLSDYRSFRWRELGRFDYTPEDCLRLHAAIEEHVVPLLARVREARQASLGVDTLRPWDLTVDPSGLPPLRPFETAEELAEISGRIFQQLDPELGRQFQEMRDGGYLDLEARRGKVPGLGYCGALPRTAMPFIYWSAVGTDGDVRVLVHEAGHAFHAIATMRAQDLIFNQRVPAEFAEVASQGMELLTLPYLDQAHGGFYTPEDAERARLAKLEVVLNQFTGQARSDAFQQWLYSEAPADVTIEQIDARWVEETKRFDPVTDWSGLVTDRAKAWQFVHIFSYPLYMLEYSLAWLGALQLYRASLEDRAGTLERYRRALALGSTRPLTQLYEAAGCRLAFDSGTVGELMRFLEGQLEAVA